MVNDTVVSLVPVVCMKTLEEEMVPFPLVRCFYFGIERCLYAHEKICVRENDGSLEDDQEITFLFASNCKRPNDKVNKSDFLYKIATIEDFYCILQNDKKVLEHGGNYVFQVNADRDLEVMLQSYQLFSFMIFFKNSKERLYGKMQNF